MYEIDEKCRECKNYGTAICNRCDMFYDEFDPIDKPPKTNADRVRSKSDEELAEFINGVEAEAIRRAGLFITVGDIQRGKEGWLDWLKQEAKDEER